MKHFLKVLGLSSLAVIIGFTMTACEDGDGHNSGSLEGKTTAERWSSWSEPGAGVTVTHSVSNDVCTITVGGTAITTTPLWSYIWKANASYDYTVTAGNMYTYTFEAWTNGEDRQTTIQWYEDNDDNVFHQTEYDFIGDDYNTPIPSFTITSERKTYTIVDEEPIPKSGVQKFGFQIANQTGTFYVKILSIEPHP